MNLYLYYIDITSFKPSFSKPVVVLHPDCWGIFPKVFDISWELFPNSENRHCRVVLIFLIGIVDNLSEHVISVQLLKHYSEFARVPDV